MNECSLRTAILLLAPARLLKADQGGPEIRALRRQHAYRNLVYFNEVDNGGHFAAWEQPQLFAEELCAAFRSLRGSH
jgi:pimeloyl-ACP methyl ester carboxylesterase